MTKPLAVATPVRVFASVSADGRIDCWTLRPQAAAARRAAGEGWRFSEKESAADGWKKAMKRGWRVRPVYVVDQLTWLAIARGE